MEKTNRPERGNPHPLLPLENPELYKGRRPPLRSGRKGTSAPNLSLLNSEVKVQGRRDCTASESCMLFCASA